MKNKRQTKILQLIAAEQVKNQQDLVRLLRAAGFAVTQATVSRDIKELSLVKVSSGVAESHYALMRSAEGGPPAAKFAGIFREGVREVRYAVNTVVIKCHAGMAMAVCASLDDQKYNEIVGTLGGDDTIFVLTASEKEAAELTKKLRRLLG